MLAYLVAASRRGHVAGVVHNGTGRGRSQRIFAELLDVARVERFLQGRIPSADPQGEAYRMLVLGKPAVSTMSFYPTFLSG